MTHFERRYASLSTDELLYIAATSELVPEAARAMELELAARGVQLERKEPIDERDRLRIQGSRRKSLYFAIGTAALAALFAWRSLYADQFWIVLAAVWALAALVNVYQAIKRLPTLTLDAEGFEYAHGVSTRKYRWADCTEFHPSWQTRWGFLMIGFKHYGATAGLYNQFDASTQDMCELLSKWEARYGLDRIQELAAPH